MSAEHINDQLFTNWAIDPAEPEAVRHLSDCESCRKEAVSFRRLVAGFRDGLVQVSESSAIALPWIEPAKSVYEVEKSWTIRRAWRLVPALVLAAIALVASLMIKSPQPAAPPHSPWNDAADNALLMQIQEDVSQQVPQALAPADPFYADAGSVNVPEKR
jgi:hypothetical protein